MNRVASEPLSKFLELYPKANAKIEQQLNKDFPNISDQDFRIAKDHICVFKELVPLLHKKHVRLDKQTCLQILEAVLEGDTEQAKAIVTGNSGTLKQNNMKPTAWTASIRWAWRAFSSGGSDMESVVGGLIRRATEAALQISDSQFLSQLDQDTERYAQRIPRFKDWADRAREKAFEYLEVTIMRTLKKLTPAVQRIEEQECMERIKHKHAQRAEEGQDKLRVDLIKHVNGLSTKATYSCVSRPCWWLVVIRLTPSIVDTRCPSIK